MTEHIAQGKFRRGLKCKQDLVLSHLRGVLYLHVPFRIELEFKNREFEKRFFWATRVNRKLTFFQSWGVILTKCLGKLTLWEKRYLGIQICQRQGILKGKRTHFRLTCVFQRRLCLGDGLLEKLRGGGGIFAAAAFFFRHQIPCMNFLGHSMKNF